MLPLALTLDLVPLQPRLDVLTAALIPAGTTPQALLDSVYQEFEQTLLLTCLEVVGTREVGRLSRAWFGMPGVRPAYRALRNARAASRTYPTSAPLHLAFIQARRAWRAVAKEAKRQDAASLCSAVAARDQKARWALFQRTAPSTSSPLSSIRRPGAQPADLPRSHQESLSNLCSAFIADAKPPEAADQAAYTALQLRVAAWAGEPQPDQPLLPPAIPAHVSDAWQLTLEDVREQCTLQRTNTAPGPDSVLPIFLKHAGDACWQALATLFTFSWRFSVTPLAWREANVMSQYKQAGSRADPTSYRPLSLTSIVARSFEHLVQRRLVELLDPSPPPEPPAPHPQPQQQPQAGQVLPAPPPAAPPPAPPAAAAAAQPPPRPFFYETQFGFRKRRTTDDAIHYLMSNIQHLLRVKAADGQHALCPVLFLDIKKAFDRVDHAILFDRLHDAGIRGRAWLWIRSFLTGRRMRTVDDALCSDWQSLTFGVPQGCVLSPLLFLVFIDPLARAIAADTDSSRVSASLYADDTAIVPAPFLHKLAATLTRLEVNELYLKHLTKATKHLDAWCAESRMTFGAAKTKLVVFHAHKTAPSAADLEPYRALKVCGFSIDLADAYTYLGVDLCARNLSWTRHRRRALEACRAASNRVMRVAMQATEPSFAAIRTLTLGYILPSCMYGCMFWARDMPEEEQRRFQAGFIGPLRAALSLPKTTHQLGMHVLCAVPTVQEMTLRAELRFARHLRRWQAHSTTNATVVMARDYTAYVEGLSPRDVLPPAYSLYPAAHFFYRTFPQLLAPDGAARRLTVEQQAALKLPPPSPPPPARPDCHQRSREYWACPSATRYDDHPPTALAQEHLRSMRVHARTATTSLSTHVIGQLGRLWAHNQWKAQHAPPPPPPPQPPAPAPPANSAAAAAAYAAINQSVVLVNAAAHAAAVQQAAPAHSTSAPLTLCLPEPGRAYFLCQGRHLSYSSTVRRARLLTGRAYTQETRCRFAKAAEPVAPGCTFAACAALAPPPAESASHVLLHCPAYQPARDALTAALQAIKPKVPPLRPAPNAQPAAVPPAVFPPPPIILPPAVPPGAQPPAPNGPPAADAGPPGIPLLLPNILLASVPPGLDKQQRSLLLRLTETFLDAVDATRRAAVGLLPLDAR